MSKRNIQRLFNVAYSTIATTQGQLSYDRVTVALTRLCDEIKETETDEFIWGEVGEFGEFNLGDLLVGAYWHFVEWHAGQSSQSYAALCALGSIFSPGMSCEPEPETGEHSAYELLNQQAKESRKEEAIRNG